MIVVQVLPGRCVLWYWRRYWPGELIIVPPTLATLLETQGFVTVVTG